MTGLLSVKDLRVGFGQDPRANEVVKGVSFDLAAGENRRIIFTPSAPVSEPPDFRIYDLYQCQSTG